MGIWMYLFYHLRLIRKGVRRLRVWMRRRRSWGLGLGVRRGFLGEWVRAREIRENWEKDKGKDSSGCLGWILNLHENKRKNKNKEIMRNRYVGDERGKIRLVVVEGEVAEGEVVQIRLWRKE